MSVSALKSPGLTFVAAIAVASLSAGASPDPTPFQPGALAAPEFRLPPPEGKENPGNVLQQAPAEGLGLFPSTDELNAQWLLGQGFSPWSSLFFRSSLSRRNFFPPGQSVPEAARVRLVPEHSRHRLGEEVPVDFVLTSTGETLEGETGGDYRGGGLPERCQVVVRGPDGHPLIGTSQMFGFGGGFIYPLRLVPPAEHKQRLPLARYVLLDQPGRYTVSVHHDFGWKATAERPYPVATGTFEIVLPTPEEAAALVDRLCQPPADRNAEYNQIISLGLLRHPVYLPALRAAAGRGLPLAIRGIQSIRDHAATAALIDLIENPDFAVAKAAMDTLSVPAWRPQTGPIPLELRARLRQPVRRLLGSQIKEFVLAGARLGASFGGATWEDVRPPLQQALERSHQERPTIGGELPEPIATLLHLGNSLRPPADNAPLPTHQTSLAEKALYFARLAGPPRRSSPNDGELGHALQQFALQNWVVRRIALAAVPSRPTPSFALLLQQCLAQDDVGSTLRAAKLAAASRDPVYLPAVLLALARVRESWAVTEIDRAARELGATPLALARAWVHKLDEPMGNSAAANRLVWVFAEVQSGEAKFAQSSVPHEMADRLAWIETWQDFLFRHGPALAAGERFSMRDPAQAPLFGTRAPGYSWPLRLECADGTSWPAER